MSAMVQEIEPKAPAGDRWERVFHIYDVKTYTDAETALLLASDIAIESVMEHHEYGRWQCRELRGERLPKHINTWLFVAGFARVGGD